MTNILSASVPRLSPRAPRFARDIQTSGVMFGLPCYGGIVSAATMDGLLDTQRRFAALGMGFNTLTIRNESLVQRARNTIVAHFLASGCDRLIFIDSDIGFTADHVLRLLAHDRDVIGGLYRKKIVDRVEFAVNLLPTADGAVRPDPETGAIPAAAAATGFLQIKRGVFDRMATAFPHLRYGTHAGEGGPGAWRDLTYAFFDCFIDPATGSYLSEDYGFCHRWRAIGGEVWVDPGLILEHFGALALSGDPMDGLLAREPAPPPAAPPPARPAPLRRAIKAPAARGGR
jgi:hypothetical protein